MKKGLERFDGHDSEDTRVASACFGITLLADPPVSDFGGGVLKAFARYRELVGDNALKVYATDTMHQHKPVSKRALTLLETWLAPDAPPRDTIAVEYSDATPYFEAPRRRFHITGNGNGRPRKHELPSALRIALDPGWGTDRYEDALEFVLQLVEWIPVRSGYAGFALEYSRYSTEEGCEHAWRQSMLHPGFEINNCVTDERLATLKDSIRTVSWLTLLDDAFVDELGGRSELVKKLPVSVKVRNFNGGVLLRGGDRPAIGDVNRNDKLPDYRAIYRAVRPLTDKSVERSQWLDLADNEEERTERWLRRWDNA